jgi:hypothetical protein
MVSFVQSGDATRSLRDTPGHGGVVSVVFDDPPVLAAQSGVGDRSDGGGGDNSGNGGSDTAAVVALSLGAGVAALAAVSVIAIVAVRRSRENRIEPSAFDAPPPELDADGGLVPSPDDLFGDDDDNLPPKNGAISEAGEFISIPVDPGINARDHAEYIDDPDSTYTGATSLAGEPVNVRHAPEPYFPDDAESATSSMALDKDLWGRGTGAEF